MHVFDWHTRKVTSELCLITGASGLSPEMVRRIRLAALQRAAGQGGAIAGQRGAIAGQRGATAGQRGATAGQRVATPFSGGFNRNAIIPATGFSRNAILPQTLNRAPVQTGVRLPQTLNRAPVQTGAQRTGAQTRLIPDATIRRRIAAMNAARVKGTSAPRQVRPLPRSTIRTEVLRPSPRSPARVDEAVLRANIVPAGLSPSSNGMRRVVSSSSSSSNESTTSSTTSSDSRVISSGSSTGSVGGLIQTGLTGVQPVGTVIAPTPELQFRTTVGGTPGTAVVAPGGVSGNGAAAPILESGPAFQVVSGDASNVILGPGASLAESMSLDIGSAAGPALVVNPTVVSPGKGVVAATPVGEVSIVQRGATLPVEDPAIFAAAGPTVSGILPVASDASLVGASNIQVAGAVPTLGSAEIAGVGSIVPGSGNVPTTLGMCFNF